MTLFMSSSCEARSLRSSRRFCSASFSSDRDTWTNGGGGEGREPEGEERGRRGGGEGEEREEGRRGGEGEEMRDW